MHELLPLNLNFQVKMSKLKRFAALKGIFRTSFIKACGIFNFHGELGPVKHLLLKITAIDMSFCP